MAASIPAAVPGPVDPPTQPSPEQIQIQLKKILASSLFVRSERLRRFLQVTVELALSGDTDRIKEYVLGRDVFDRGQDYDPRVDSIVRVEANRLRKKLREYYAEFGPADQVSIEFPPGNYVPTFRYRPAAAPRLSNTTAMLESRPLNPRTVAVLPFANLSPDPDQDFFCDGITEEILNTLTSVPQLTVVARTSVFRFKGKSTDVREIGRQLHAGSVIEGSVRKAENRLRISAQVIDATEGVRLWSGNFDRDLSDVFAVQDEIALAIADSLHVTLAGPVIDLPSATRHPPLEAYTSLLKGRHFWNQVSQEGIQPALGEFTRAIALCRDYAPPYAALADTYLKTSFWGVTSPREGILMARQAALKAVRLDPKLADAYALLSIIACCYDWNWAEGTRLLRTALDLQPSNMNVLSFAALQHVFRGEFEQARVWIEKSSELDPVSPWSFRNQSWYYYYQRQFGRAADAMKSALALDPHFREGQFLLAYAYLGESRYSDAIAQLLELPEGPYKASKWGALGEAYAASGNTQAALEFLGKIDDLERTGYVSPITRASIYAGLQDWAKVFEQLERAYQEHTPWLSALKVDPRYDPIRSDPRTADLLKRMNLL
jgi:TolB-like protein/tetratricopeptide (TPR) repeat protein